MAGGRPSLYSPEMCDVLEEALATGKSLAAASSEIGIHKDTANEWAKVHDEFSVAIKHGRARGMALWEGRLSGQAVMNAGNTAAIIFAMKNLYREDWSDKQEVAHSGEVKIEGVQLTFARAPAAPE